VVVTTGISSTAPVGAFRRIQCVLLQLEKTTSGNKNDLTKSRVNTEFLEAQRCALLWARLLLPHSGRITQPQRLAGTKKQENELLKNSQTGLFRTAQAEPREPWNQLVAISEKCQKYFNFVRSLGSPVVFAPPHRAWLRSCPSPLGETESPQDCNLS